MKSSPLLNTILIPPLPGRDAVDIFKCSGKMKLVGIAHRIADVCDGKLGQLQKLSRFRHTIRDKELLRGFPHIFVKNLSEITPVEPAGISDILHRNIVLEILLNKGYGFFYIKIPQSIALAALHPGGGTDKAVDKKMEMSNQVKGRSIFMVDNI